MENDFDFDEFTAYSNRKRRKDIFRRLKRDYVVSTYNSYEWITTQKAFCKFFLRIQLHRRGYSALRDMFYPSRKVSNFLYKRFNLNTYNFNSNCSIERHRPGTGQVTHHSPWSDCI
jgi:hypothetical protein